MKKYQKVFILQTIPLRLRSTILNKIILNNTALIEESYNCRNKNNCPLDGKCLTPNIVYEAEITLNQLNYKQKINTETAKIDFKHRFNNHKKSFNLEHCENDRTITRIRNNKT